LPLASKVAVLLARGRDMDPVAVNESVLGSYSSADAIGKPESSPPPAIRTLPLCSKVALGHKRGTNIGPAVAANPTGWGTMGGAAVGGAAVGASVGVAAPAPQAPTTSAAARNTTKIPSLAPIEASPLFPCRRADLD
jgi:hypothetical protein